jgi:hypothetical protein
MVLFWCILLTLAIEAKYGNQTKIHTIDFSAPDEKTYEGLASLISGLEIGVLGA